MPDNSSLKLITIIGGSGFLGRHLVRALARRGYRIRVAVRRPDLAGHLQPLGSVGQIMPVQANIRFPASLAAACQDAETVINLVGILYNTGSQTFDALHAFGAAAAAGAAKSAGASQFIHLSAIGANEASHSTYARTKAQGEKRVAAEFPGAVVIRPSIVFGPEDQFFNRFAALARFTPALPLIGGGKTKFQPVFVGDIAEAIARIVDRGTPNGITYELGGPETHTFKQLLRFTLKTIGRRKVLVPVPFAVAKIQAAVLQLFPKPPLTLDQVELLKQDNIVSVSAERDGRTLDGLGIAPVSIEAIVPSYLFRYRKAGQFTTLDEVENGK